MEIRKLMPAGGLKGWLRLTRILPLAVLLAWGCEGMGPQDQPPEEKVPLIEISVPKALTGSSSASQSLVALHKGLGPGDDARNVFEPFRVSLAVAQSMIDMSNEIITALNELDLPDTLDIVDEKGERILITTDAARDLATRIEIHSPAGDKYMQVNYNKGQNKIRSIFDPTVTDSVSDVAWAELFYDATTDVPVLEGKLNFVYEDTTSTTEIIAKTLYVELTQSGAQISVNGGVVYNFYFGEGADTANPGVYVADHAYMYQAVADTSGDKALANLYFPPATADSSSLPRPSVGGDYLDIVHNWVNLEENTAVQDILWWIVESNPQSSFAYDTPENFQDILEFIHAENDTMLVDLIFLINLDNPIAYSALEGYVAHGDSVAAEYTDLGDPAAIPFTLSPAGIAELSVGFLTD